MDTVNIVICQGSSCFARGNKKNLKLIQSFLSDHKLSASVSFKGQLCSGLCNQSPVIIINNKTYTEVDAAKLRGILTDVFKVKL